MEEVFVSEKLMRLVQELQLVLPQELRLVLALGPWLDELASLVALA